VALPHRFFRSVWNFGGKAVPPCKYTVLCEEMVCPLEFSSQCAGGRIGGGPGLGEAAEVSIFQLDTRRFGFCGAISEIAASDRVMERVRGSGFSVCAKTSLTNRVPQGVRESLSSAELLISLGRAWQTSGGTSRAIIPLKPKNGLNGAPQHLLPVWPRLWWGYAPSFSAQVRFGEPGAPVPFLWGCAFGQFSPACKKCFEV
jgi:hypothetical protein